MMDIPKLFVLTLLLLSSIHTTGQSISPEVMAAAGDTYIASNQTRLNWTMGEAAVETYTLGNTRLTLGFHQMYVHPMSVPTTEASPLANLIRLSPNPTSGILGVENLSTQTLSVIATDGGGRQVFAAQNIGFQHELDFSNFPAGNYFLQFFSKNKPITIFKIVKQ